jgi:hypothetical protein
VLIAPSLHKGSMFEYTFENHYQYGWGGELFNFPDTTQNYHLYQAKLGKVKHTNMSWRDACLFAATDMWSKCLDRYVMVCYSGGIDSEVALRSFLEQNIPVRAAIMKMKYDLNFHDYKLAIKFCETNNVKYHLFEIDAMEFLHNDMWSYAHTHKMISPQIPFQLWLLDQFDEFPIVCGGDLPLYVEDKKIKYKFKPQTTTVSRHLAINNRVGGPLFHIHNPEQVYSFLNDEIVKLWRKQFISSPIDNVYTLKPLIYEKYFPNLTPRWKWTGVEMFSPLDKKKLRPQMENKYIDYNNTIIISVDDLEQMVL